MCVTLGPFLIFVTANKISVYLYFGENEPNRRDSALVAKGLRGLGANVPNLTLMCKGQI